VSLEAAKIIVGSLESEKPGSCRSIPNVFLKKKLVYPKDFPNKNLTRSLKRKEKQKFCRYSISFLHVLVIVILTCYQKNYVLDARFAIGTSFSLPFQGNL